MSACPLTTPVGNCVLPEGHKEPHHVVSSQIRMGPVKVAPQPKRKMGSKR